MYVCKLCACYLLTLAEYDGHSHRIYCIMLGLEADVVDSCWQQFMKEQCSVSDAVASAR